MSHNGGDPCSLCRNTSKQLSHEWNSGKIKYMCVCTYVCLSLAHFWAVHHSTVTPWMITLFRWISITLKNLPLKQENLLLLLFVLCQTCQLTHEEVKDGHVHDVQQSSPAVIRWSLFDFLAVVRVHLPPEEFQNITQTASCSHFVFHFYKNLCICFAKTSQKCNLFSLFRYLLLFEVFHGMICRPWCFILFGCESALTWYCPW